MTSGNTVRLRTFPSSKNNQNAYLKINKIADKI